MRVLLVADALYLHTRRWAAGLADGGADVTLLSATPFQHDRVRWVSYDVPPWRPWRPGRWLHRRRTCFRQAMRNVQPRIVHYHFLGPFDVFPHDLDGVPLIVSPWGSDIVRSAADAPEVKDRKVAVLRGAARVVASSNFLAEATRRYADLNAEQVVTQYWGVDLERFAPSRPPINRPVIGFAKALEPVYAPECLIEAFAAVSAEFGQSQLLVAGLGRLHQRLVAQAQRLHLNDRIHWLGHLPHEEMPQFFGKVAVSAICSESESLGLSALESEAMKVPVVAVRVGGLPEAVVHERTGLLVEPRDPRALAEGIIRLLTDHDLRHALAEEGRRHVERSFDWRKTITSMFDTYRDVLAS